MRLHLRNPLFCRAGGDLGAWLVRPTGSRKSARADSRRADQRRYHIRNLLTKLGILDESGGQDWETAVRRLLMDHR
jgi:hypothetical protein